MKKLLSAVLVAGTIAMPINMAMCNAEEETTPIIHTQMAAVKANDEKASADESVINVEEQVEYIPDDKFILGSSALSKMIEQKQKLTFREPNKNSTNPLEYELFPDGSPKATDIAQGAAGTCYLLAALASIAEMQPELIKNSITDNNDGTVTVKVYDLVTAKAKFVKVQKTIPDLPMCCKFLKKECLWVQMFIKGLIAANLSQHSCGKLFSTMKYSEIEGGYMDSTLKMLTGKDINKYIDLTIFRAGEETIYNIIKEAIENNKPITCDFCHNRFVRIFRLAMPFDRGLVCGHAYSVIGTCETDSGEKLIKVRNPWNSFGAAYDSNGNRCVETNDENLNGYFTLKLKDFYNACSSLQIVNDNDLKPMSLLDKIKEKKRVPIIAAAGYLLLSIVIKLLSKSDILTNNKIINNAIFNLISILISFALV